MFRRRDGGDPGEGMAHDGAMRNRAVKSCCPIIINSVVWIPEEGVSCRCCFSRACPGLGATSVGVRAVCVVPPERPSLLSCRVMPCGLADRLCAMWGGAEQTVRCVREKPEVLSESGRILWPLSQADCPGMRLAGKSFSAWSDRC